jgi:putative protease
MELSFSRGFSPGWLGGCDHKMLVPATSSAKRGVRLGTVAGVRGGRVAVDLAAGLAGGVTRGDGVAFESGATSDDSVGGRVYEVFDRGRSVTDPVTGGRVELAFGRDALDVSLLKPGQAVWKTDDPQLTARLRRSFAGDRPRWRRPVDLHVTAAPGEPVRVAATTAAGLRVEVVSAEPARTAARHALDAEVLRAQLGRLGGTAHELRSLTADISGGPMVPFSVLGRLRHDLVAALDAAADRDGAGAACPDDAAAAVEALRRRDDRTAEAGGGADSSSSPATIHVLVRSLAQLEAVLELGERRLYAEFADIREYADAVRRCRAAGATINLATPRIQKPDELGVFRLLVRQQPDGILVRNWAGLRFFRDAGLPVIGDFSLNAANEITADFFRSAGCDRVTASYDLNREQLLALAGAADAATLEVVVHQHMPMFHMEHCVFCAVLSPGRNKNDCGRPCDRHVVSLRDRIGVEHPLTADVGCRNTLYNAVPQSAAEAVSALLEAGVRHLRIEFLAEQAAEVARVVRGYRDLVAGRKRARDLWRELEAANRVGVTRGTLEERRDPLALL